ncbi:MAG: response regulator transcription factor [Phycisphaera sp. RhM]|nr:response regulator transcription factor [Phycisphaera sp. RhM]
MRADTDGIFSPPPMDSNVAVSIVDDDIDVRRAINLLVRSASLPTQVFASATEYLQSEQFDTTACLVLDVRMPGMSGLQLQQELIARGVDIPMVFISAYDGIASASTAMRRGAVDFISKPFEPQVLIQRIHEAINRDRRARAKRAQRKQVESRISNLTAREYEVMTHLCNGDSTKVIASKLNISPKTVDNHRTQVFDKMQVDNAAQLVLLTSLHEMSD